MSELKLTVDESDVIRALDNLEKKFAETGKKADATGKVIGSALSGSSADTKRAADSLNEYTRAQEKLASTASDRIQKGKEVQAGLKKYREEQQAANAATDAAAKKNMSAAKSVQIYTDALNESSSKSDGAAKSSGGLSSAVGATPWGRIALAIGAVIGFLSKFQEGMDLVSRVTAGVSAVMTVLVQRLGSLGKTILAFFSSDWVGVIKNGQDAFVGLADSVANAFVGATTLEGRLQSLRDAQLDAAISTAKLTVASEKQQSLAQQQGKSFNEKIVALKNAIALEAEIAKRQVGFAEQGAQLARESFALSAKGVSDREELITKELASINARNEADKKRIELLGRLTEVEKQRTEFIKKNLEAVDNAISKLNLDLEVDPIESAILAVRKKYEALTKLAEDSLLKLVEVEKLRPLSGDEIAQRQKLQDAIVDIIEKGADAEIAALLEGIRKQNEIEDAKQKLKEAAGKKDINAQKKYLKDLLDLQNQQISITQAEFDNLIATLRAGGAEEQDIKTAQNEFDRRVKFERIEALIQYQKSILALLGNGVEADIIRANIQELQTILEGLDIPEPKAKDGKAKSIYDILGIKFGDPAQQKAFEEAVSIIQDSLKQLTAARIEEAEAATRAAQEKVDAAQESLDAEKEIAEQGLANFVDLRQKDLDTAKQQRDIAMKEESKAKKAQIALDSVGQISGLITASVNIFKGLSSIPVVGIPLAIATIALMFGAFAKAKADALKAASAPKLRLGKRFDGPTHEQGNEDIVHDGKRAYKVENGEWLIATQHSKEHNSFLANLNRGKYRGVNLAAMADGRSDTSRNMSASASRTEVLRTRREQVGEQQHLNALAGVYEKVGDRIVQAIEEKPEAYPWKDGYIKVQKKSGSTYRETVTPSH